MSNIDTRDFNFWHAIPGEDDPTVVILYKEISVVEQGSLTDEQLDNEIEGIRSWLPVESNAATPYSPENAEKYSYLSNVKSQDGSGKSYCYQEAAGSRWDGQLADVMRQLQLYLDVRGVNDSVLVNKNKDISVAVEDWRVADWQVVPDKNFPDTYLVHDTVIWEQNFGIKSTKIKTVYGWIPYEPKLQTNAVLTDSL